MSMVSTDSAPVSGVEPEMPLVTIRPRSGWQLVHLGEVWAFRDLLWMLTVRDVKVRYRQAVLGAAWAVIQPVVSMVVLTIFFGMFMGISAKVTAELGADVPYPVFLFAGLLPWTLLSASVSGASMSLVSNSQMVSKIYMPRLLLPISSVGAPLLDYAISFVVLLIMMVCYGVGIGFALLLVPLFMVSVLLASMGVGIFLAGVTVAYRDFRYVVPFMIQIWFYLTPVIYPVKFLPEKYRWLLQLNPASGPIEAMRAAVLGQPIVYTDWLISTLVAVVMTVFGLAYFARVERRFADVI